MSKAYFLNIKAKYKRSTATFLGLIAFSSQLILPAFAEPPQSDKNWDQLEHKGVEALDSNKYWIAEPLLTSAVVQAGNFGLSDIRLAKSLGELGRLYAVRGCFDKAEPYLEESFCVKENALGRGNNQLIAAMGSLIRFYILYGTVRKSYPLTEELLAIVEGKLHEPLDQSQGQAKYQKGVPMQAWAGIADPIARDPLLEWAITCDDLGTQYYQYGNYDIADRLFKAALDLKATILGKEHLSLANSYDSLGELCVSRNELKDAESYLRDSLALTEKILPSDDPKVYIRLDKLAKCLLKEGKYKEAEDLYVRAQNFWGPDSLNDGRKARALYTLGSLYVDHKRYAEAAPLLHQALDLAEQANGPLSAQLVPYLQRYSYTLYYLGRKPEMTELQNRVNAIATKPE